MAQSFHDSHLKWLHVDTQEALNIMYMYVHVHTLMSMNSKFC